MTTLHYYRRGKKFEILKLARENENIYYVRPKDTHSSYYEFDQSESMRELVLESHIMLCFAVLEFLNQNGFPYATYTAGAEIDYGVKIGALSQDEVDAVLGVLDAKF